MKHVVANEMKKKRIKSNSFLFIFQIFHNLVLQAITSGDCFKKKTNITKQKEHQERNLF